MGRKKKPANGYTLLFGLKGLNPLTPLVKWSGGKYSEIHLFKDHYPKEFELYIEPFVGGGAVLFDLEFDNNVISDVHDELINFYTQIHLGKAEEIYNIVSTFSCNEETYYRVRDEYECKNTVKEAARFYYLRKTCFRGMLRYNSKGKFNIPFGRYTSFDISDLKDKRYEDVLKQTDIRKVSFEEIFEEFDDENYFVFLDPPYDSKFSNYGYCKFGEKYHKLLADVFKSTNNKCLMVIGKTDFTEKLYRGYIVDSYSKRYMFKIHSGRVGSEIDNQHLVIKNY